VIIRERGSGSAPPRALSTTTEFRLSNSNESDVEVNTIFVTEGAAVEGKREIAIGLVRNLPAVELFNRSIPVSICENGQGQQSSQTDRRRATPNEKGPAKFAGPSPSKWL
jgi:hypothetical protein